MMTSLQDYTAVSGMIRRLRYIHGLRYRLPAGMQITSLQDDGRRVRHCKIRSNLSNLQSNFQWSKKNKTALLRASQLLAVTSQPIAT
jgi:hypothetical protein